MKSMPRGQRRTLGLAAGLLLALMLPRTMTVGAQEGACGSAVTVAAGDTLLAIAQRCGTTVNALLAVNPSITNPDLIFAGQTLAIPGNEPSSATELPDAGPTSVDSAASAGPSVMVSPQSGLPGTVLQVSATGFPAGGSLLLGAGLVASEYTVLAIGEAGEDGALAIEVAIPQSATPGESWVIVVETEDRTLQAISNPFAVIGEAGQGGQASYVVQPGDTLSGIAQALGTSVAALLAANPSISDARLIFAGQVLVMPGEATSAPAAQLYIIQPGDTLSGIAQAFGTTIAAILAANPALGDPKLIYAGQAIAIP
jgi:LysM repeat protein